MCYTDETLRGALGTEWQSSSVPRPTKMSSKHRRLVDAVRASSTKMFWELFAGMAVLTCAFAGLGWQCAPPIDVMNDPEYDLLSPFFLTIVFGLIAEARFAVIHLGPPCSSFSMALNRYLAHALRSIRFPGGLPSLDAHKRSRCVLAMRWRRFPLGLRTRSIRPAASGSLNNLLRA